MRVGCCIATVEQLDVLEAAGSDFCELPVAHVARLNEADFAALASRLDSSSVPARRANGLLPGDLRLVGPVVDRGRIADYLALALARLARLGVTVVVFGSGPSRRVPSGFDRRRALDQVEEFVRTLAEAAAEHGITVAIEHLRREETNLLNRLGETADFIRVRELSNVRLLADIYHLMEEGESLDVVADCGSLVAHAHLADSGRVPPGQGSWDLAGFLMALRGAGYRGDASIECAWSDFPSEAPSALRHVRQLVD